MIKWLHESRAVIVSPYEMDELNLFERFLKREHRPVPIVTGGTLVVLFFSGSESDVSVLELLRRYRSQFEVQINRRDKSNQVIKDFSEVEVNLTSPVAFNALMSQFRPESWVKVGFQDLLESGRALADDKVTSYSYALRPWISKDLELTTMAWGSIYVNRAGRFQTLYFPSTRFPYLVHRNRST